MAGSHPADPGSSPGLGTSFCLFAFSTFRHLDFYTFRLHTFAQYASRPAILPSYYPAILLSYLVLARTTAFLPSPPPSFLPSLRSLDTCLLLRPVHTCCFALPSRPSFSFRTSLLRFFVSYLISRTQNTYRLSSSPIHIYTYTPTHTQQHPLLHTCFCVSSLSRNTRRTHTHTHAPRFRYPTHTGD